MSPALLLVDIHPTLGNSTDNVPVDERSELQKRITSSGGDYSGELNKKCTHLIVARPEGQKYLAARKWNLKVVSVEWLNQSVERGMILDEQYFDPLLPLEERGRGARDDPGVAVGKRQRLLDSFAEPDGPRRKLRKTASMKLSSQRETVWGDILGMKASASAQTESSPREDDAAPKPVADADADADAPSLAPSKPKDEGIFSSSYFYIQDFESRKRDILAQTVTALGGHVCQTPEDLYLTESPTTPSHRFTVVPQDSHSTPAPPPANALGTSSTVTEFFIERCLRDKKLHDPAAHVLGRPFPVHPIPGFEGLRVCSAGFQGIDLHHLDRAVRQLGARFEETFRKGTSVLVCKELRLVRREKLRLAVDNGIPVVGEAWIWECVAKGERVGFEGHMFPELKQRVEGASSGENPGRARRGFELDEGAFTAEASSRSRGKAGGASGSGGFHTARTHPFDYFDDFSGKGSKPKPLKEMPSNAAPRPESPAPAPADDDLPPTAETNNVPHPSDRKEKPARREVTELQEESESQKKETEDTKRRDEASRKEREVLAFSTRLTSLTDANPAEEGPRRRKRGIFGRATSNVSAPGSVVDRGEGPGAGDEGSGERHSAPGWEGDGDEGAEEGGEDGPSLLTQVGYFDPGAAEARERVMGRLEERRVKTR